MDWIGCNWLWNIWLEFLKVVWMDCPEKTFHAVWMGKFIRSQCGNSAEEANGLDPLESHRLERPSAPDVPELGNATPAYFWRNVATHYQALVKVDITGVTQGAISKILKQVQQTGSPNQRPLGHLLAAGDPLQWRHNGHDGVSSHQPHRLFGRRSKNKAVCDRSWHT